MKKLLLILFLGVFLFSSVSATFTATYEQPTRALDSGSFIWKATNGGTTFTSIPYNAVAFDYFDDNSVVNDSIYFSEGAYGPLFAGLRFNVGTTIVADNYTLVWEYYKLNEGWVSIEDIVDDTESFSVAGVNDVRFPQQWQPYTVNIQGFTSGLWVRVRLAEVTNITEGGANQIDDITYGLGVLTISGTTDEEPATFTKIYDWLKANQPHISVIKTGGGSFDFTKVGLDINSRLYTTNEVIELGQDCRTNNNAGYNNLDYVTSGIKKDNLTGYSGSTFIIHGRANSRVIQSGSQSKFYGTTFRTGKGTSDYYSYAGYMNMHGEWIDCNVELSTKLPTVGNIVSNVRIIGALLIASTNIGTYSNVNYLCTANSLFYVYRQGFTLDNFGYQFKNSYGTLFYLYQASGQESNYTWKLKNPSTPLNTLADSIKPLAIPYNYLGDISQLWYYDASTDTYTDYTSEAGSVTTNDVPLGGDVGDMYYFGMTTSASPSTSLSIYITKTTDTNDYEYKWEYYEGGAWKDINTSWDASSNLGATGNFFTNNADSDNININGISKDYLRATIVTKGTSSPVADKIQQRKCSAVNKWHLKETYSFDLKVIDENGIAIDGATVIATDENGEEIFSVTTNVNGTIPEQELLAKHWYFEPVGNPTTLISENIYSTFNLRINKTGYEVYETNDLNLGKEIDWIIPLEERTWNYTTPLLLESINNSLIGVMAIDTLGNMKIAGNLYENTNSSYINSIPQSDLIWGIKGYFALTKTGTLYLLGELVEGIL